MRSPILRCTIATFEPSGYITAANAAEFQQQLKEVVTSQSHATLLVDMAQVEFLDSAGLMALASALSLAESLGKRFSLCSLEPSVHMLFELTQLDRVFEIFENRQVFESTLAQQLAA